MSVSFDDNNRQNIPRWLPFNQAKSLTILEKTGSKHIPVIEFQKSHIEKFYVWERHKELPHAIELVGSALMCGDFDNKIVLSAADFIIKRKNIASNLALEIANHYFNKFHSIEESRSTTCSILREEGKHFISSLKSSLSVYHRNPILWADLSYYYATIGHLKKSKKCMDIAIELSPNNVFLLRSASRCYWHCNDPEKGLYLIRKSPISKESPSLVSSEIAISELMNKKPLFSKNARSLIKSGNFEPKFLSELESTLGTLEFSNGSNKIAKSLIQSSLEDPNENTIAQAEWISKGIGLFFKRPEKVVLGTYEADARKYLREGMYEKSFHAALDWLKFQPFSSRPALFGSYVASVCMGDYNSSISITETGLCADPDDIILNNNLAFSLASIGNTVKAKEIINKLNKRNLNEQQKAIISATSGLIEFKNGNYDTGRELYKKAIDSFGIPDRDYYRAVAMLFWGREELIINSSFSKILLDKTIKVAEKINVKEIINHARYLLANNNKGSDLHI